MTHKKQRSLFWIISTIYLTTIFTGIVLAAIFLFMGTIIIDSLPQTIASLILYTLHLTGFLLGTKVAVNYVCDRAFVKKEDIFNISVIVATIPIVFRLTFGLDEGFKLADLIVLVQSLAIFYTARYFLNKRITGAEKENKIQE